MIKSRVPSRQQRGFTLLEMALALTIMAAVTIAMMVTRNLSAGGVDVTETTYMDQAVVALSDFARRNHRLPCPDVNGDGFEDLVAGLCPAAIKAGGLPYYSLGMALSGPLGTGLDRQLAYGVYRGGGAAVRDLTQSVERSLPSVHTAPNVSFDNADDLKQALINAANAALDANEIYVTGNDVNSGVSNCASNRVANMAYVLAFAGSRNADGAGSDFDGAHLAGVGWSSATQWASIQSSTCFVGPGKTASPTYDDQVRAISFTELIGVLSR